MTRGGFEKGGALVEMAIDVDVTELPALETGFMVAGVVTSKRHVMVAASPPDLGVSEGDFFFLS